MSILREKSDHTPPRKKRGDTAHRASSLKARIVIQETLAADMSTLHVGNSLDAREETSDLRRASVVTPDGDDDDDEPFNESDNNDYNLESVAPPKQQKKTVKKKERAQGSAWL